MRHPASLALHAYWNDLRRGRSAPEPFDVDPAALGALLPYTFVVDGPEGGIARLRLSGTRLDALFGRDLRGAPFDDLWTSASAQLSERALATARGCLAPVSATARGAPFERAPCDFELLLLPFRGSRRILGSLAATPVPRWTGLLPVGRLDLAHPRVLSGKALAVDAAQRRPVPARPIARVGHLDVYAGGRSTTDGRGRADHAHSARLNG